MNVPANYNYICYSNLQDYSEINPSNKSYIVLNTQGIIVEIVEKRVASQFFNVGGYFFNRTSIFFDTYEKLSQNGFSELYLSAIVEDLIINGGVFIGKEVKNYMDWGTLGDWQKYRSKFKTYFFDLDGIFIKNAAQYFKPKWDQPEVIVENMKILQNLSQNPENQIFFVTARTKKYKPLIEKILKEWNIHYEDIITGCLHSKRILVNDFSNNTGYPTCEAINIPRDSKELFKYLG